MDQWPKISVVIPVRNEEKYIASTLDYLLKQDYPRDRMEIFVANGDSTDRTAEIVSETAANDSRVRLLDNPGRFSSAGRNVGLRNATGDIITFVDGHTYIDNDQLLKNTAVLMSEKGVDVLSRPQFLDTPDNDLFQQAVSLARKSIIGHGLDSTIYTDEDKYVDPSSSGASYKKEVFEKIGYYDEVMDAAEDVELNYRAAKSGYKSYTSLKLAVYYYPRVSLGALFRQMERYGRGRFRLAEKHPGTLSLSTLIPLLITFGIPLLGLLSIFISELGYLFLPAAGLYLLGIAGWSLSISIRHGLKFLPKLPFVYLAIHGGLGCGFMFELWRRLMGRKP